MGGLEDKCRNSNPNPRQQSSTLPLARLPLASINFSNTFMFCLHFLLLKVLVYTYLQMENIDLPNSFSDEKITICYVQHCSSVRIDGVSKDITFHHFPRSEELCQLWLSKCMRQDLQNKKLSSLRSHFVCSKHFRKEDYVMGKLKRSSVPSLNLPRFPSGMYDYNLT